MTSSQKPRSIPVEANIPKLAALAHKRISNIGEPEAFLSEIRKIGQRSFCERRTNPMPVTVIVGGQYGSEGKGKVAHWLAENESASVAVRTGGPNAGHTVEDVPRPSCRATPTCQRQRFCRTLSVCLVPGSYIDPDLLLDEVSRTGLSADRLLIDPNATVITEDDKARERNSTLRASIGSTQSGTGAAVVKRIERRASTELAQNDDRLRPFIAPVTLFFRSQLSSGKRIILEGTQGFGLSLLHSPTYPYVTSRDTTAAAFVSEVGLSPLDVDEIVWSCERFLFVWVGIRVRCRMRFLGDGIRGIWVSELNY